MDDGKRWFYEKEGTRCGPFSTLEVEIALKSGSISVSNLIWRDGLEKWLRVAELTEFAELTKSSSSPPPLPLAYLSQGYAIALMTAPLWGTFLIQVIVASLVGGSHHVAANFIFSNDWIFWVLLNSLLAYYDSKYLESAGVDMNKIFVLGIILIPLYLYFRGTRMKKHYGLTFIESQWSFLGWFVFLVIGAQIK